MRNMNENLWKLLDKAKKDKSIRKKLLETQHAKDPALALCECATELGFPTSVGELIGGGEEFSDKVFKSHYGCPTEPPRGWEDSMDLFFASLKGLD